MKTKILKIEVEYNEACERIYVLMNGSEDAIEPNSPEGEELELLSLLVEKYEQENHQLEQPFQIEFRKEQMKHETKDN